MKISVEEFTHKLEQQVREGVSSAISNGAALKCPLVIKAVVKANKDGFLCDAGEDGVDVEITIYSRS